MKEWARLIVMILQGLGIVGNFASAVLVWLYGSHRYLTDTATAMCVPVIGLAVGAYIFYWFGSHAEYFD